jgi:hypothetical protein
MPPLHKHAVARRASRIGLENGRCDFGPGASDFAQNQALLRKIVIRRRALRLTQSHSIFYCGVMAPRRNMSRLSSLFCF